MFDRSDFETLPIEWVMDICTSPDVETASTLGELSVTTYNKMQTLWPMSFWKEKYKLHFPHLFDSLEEEEKKIEAENLLGTMNWYEKFRQTYALEYENLSRPISELFSLIKEGKVEELDRAIQVLPILDSIESRGAS